MTLQLDTRVSYDRPDGSKGTLFLGILPSTVSAAAGLKSALEEVRTERGSKPRLDIFNYRTGALVYSTNLPDKRG